VIINHFTGFRKQCETSEFYVNSNKTLIEMNLDFYKDLHERQFATKEKLAQRTNTIVKLLIFLIGTISYVLVSFKNTLVTCNIVFYSLFALSCALLSLSTVFLIRSYNVPMLRSLDKPSKWYEYWNDLTEKYSNSKGTFKSPEEEFTDHLIKLYVKMTDENVDSNDLRGNRLVKSNYYALVSVIFVALTSLFFYLNNYYFSD
jgi:hypothetical protein